MDANVGAGEMEESEHGGGLAAVADGEAAVRQQPGDRALHGPAVPAEPLAGLDAAAGDRGCDAASPERSTMAGIVVPLAAVQLPGAEARESGLAGGPPDRRHGIDERQRLLRVMDVR